MKKLSVWLVLLTLVLAACGKPPAPPESAKDRPKDTPGQTEAPAKKDAVKVRMAQALDGLDFMALYVARYHNFFADEGINLDVILMQGGGGPNVQAVLSGQAQFTPSSVSVVSGALRQNQKLLMVHNLLDRLIVNIAMRKDVAERLGITESSPVEAKLAALKGLRIGVTRPGALTDLTMMSILQEAGLDKEKDVEIVATGAGAAALAALENDKVDVISHVSPVPEQAVARGNAIMLIDNAKGEIPSLQPFLGLALVTTPSYAEANPEVVRAMSRAVSRAVKWIQENPPKATAEVLSMYLTDISPDVLEKVVESIRPALVPTGEMSEEAALVPQRQLIMAGVQQEIIPPEQFLSNKYLPGK